MREASALLLVLAFVTQADAGLLHALSTSRTGLTATELFIPRAEYNRADGSITFRHLKDIRILRISEAGVGTASPSWIDPLLYAGEPPQSIRVWTAEIGSPFPDPYRVDNAIEAGTQGFGFSYQRFGYPHESAGYIVLIPEPSILSLTGSSLLALSLLRRRRPRR